MEKLTKTINGFEISIYFMDVSPQFANYILEKFNTRNRHQNEKHVSILVQNILKGLWMFNGDTICFDADGVLIDGQHRLKAIVKSGITLPCLIVSGLDPKSIETKDTNIKPRNMQDLLQLDGVPDAGNLSSICTKFFALKKGVTAVAGGNKNTGGHCDIQPLRLRVAHYYKHQDLYNTILKHARSWDKGTRLIPRNDIGGIMLYLLLEKNHDWNQVYTFFDLLHDYSAPLPIPSMGELRRKLQTDAIKRREHRMPATFRQALIAKTWNFYLCNKPTKILSYSPEKEGKIDFL